MKDLENPLAGSFSNLSGLIGLINPQFNPEFNQEFAVKHESFYNSEDIETLVYGENGTSTFGNNVNLNYNPDINIKTVKIFTDKFYCCLSNKEKEKLLSGATTREEKLKRVRKYVLKIKN